MHTQTDLAYAAGILDGEGTIGLTKYPDRGVPRIKPYLVVGMTDPVIPLWFADLFGGGIQLLPRRQAHHKRLTRWTVQGKKVGPVLESLLPYLKLKREQAILVMEFCERQKSRVGRSILEEELVLREQALTQIHDLNRRGVLIRGA